MEDELDRSPFRVGPDDLNLRHEVHELDFAVAFLSVNVPLFITIIAVLLWKLSKKSAVLLREAVGASAAASSHAQGSMTIEIKGADGMPDMRVSMLEDAASAAAVSVPTEAPTDVTRVVRLTCTAPRAGRRYGLPPNLQWEVEEEGASQASTVTREQLVALESEPAFQQWAGDRHLSADQLQAISQRLGLFRELRRIDPVSFRELTPTVALFESTPPPRHLLLLDYVVSVLLCLLPAVSLWLNYGRVSNLVVSSLVGWPILAWCQSRSPLKRRHQLWYEMTTSGHKAAPTLVLLAWLVELAYVTCSLGAGALVSLVMRCFLPCRQALGERLLGVRLIVEKVSYL